MSAVRFAGAKMGVNSSMHLSPSTSHAGGRRRHSSSSHDTCSSPNLSGPTPSPVPAAMIGNSTQHDESSRMERLSTAKGSAKTQVRAALRVLGRTKLHAAASVSMFLAGILLLLVSPRCTLLLQEDTPIHALRCYTRQNLEEVLQSAGGERSKRDVQLVYYMRYIGASIMGTALFYCLILLQYCIWKSEHIARLHKNQPHIIQPKKASEERAAERTSFNFQDPPDKEEIMNSAMTYRILVAQQRMIINKRLQLDQQQKEEEEEAAGRRPTADAPLTSISETNI